MPLVRILEGQAEFVVGLVPLGGASLALAAGDYKSLAFSLAGDAIPVMGWAAKRLFALGRPVGHALRWSKNAPEVLAAGKALGRGGQPVYHFAAGEFSAGSGRAAQNLLRLAGVPADVARAATVPACFVAGTDVVGYRIEEPPTVALAGVVSEGDRDPAWTLVLYAAAGVAVAVAAALDERRRRKRQNKAEAAIDQVFEEPVDDLLGLRREQAHPWAALAWDEGNVLVDRVLAEDLARAAAGPCARVTEPASSGTAHGPRLTPHARPRVAEAAPSALAPAESSLKRGHSAFCEK